MCNIPTRKPTMVCEHKTWGYVDGRRVRLVFPDEPKPNEPYVVIERPNLVVPPPTMAMKRWIHYMQAKYN